MSQPLYSDDQDAAMTPPPGLYHFTCGDHGHAKILETGLIRPGLDGLAWFTDDQMATRTAVGLTSYLLACDRMAYRFAALDASTCIRWAQHPAARTAWGRALSLTPGAMPGTWWVSESPVPAVAA